MWYQTDNNSVTEPQVFAPGNANKVGETAVALAKVGEGRLGYIGHVNAERARMRLSLLSVDSCHRKEKMKRDERSNRMLRIRLTYSELEEMRDSSQPVASIFRAIHRDQALLFAWCGPLSLASPRLQPL